ncbi:MAG TPA: AI-2E family transporter [Candidatus Limnocylindrales bacterium]|nr:AI-2E family transporter [Candidatus Limnocylindrales bacterium]
MAPTDQARAGFGPLSPRVVLVLAGSAVVAVVLHAGSSALGPFVVGLVLAYLLDMPVERMSRIGLPRWLAVLIVYAVVVVLVVEGGVMAMRPLSDEFATFIREFPKFTAQVTDIYAHLDLLPAVRHAIDTWLADLGSGIAGIDPAAVLPVVSGIAGIVGSIVGYVLIPVWIFYLIKDRPALTAAAERSMPDAWWPDVSAVSSLVLRVFGQWVRGQLVLGVTVGAATFAGLLLLSVTVDPIFGRFAILLSVVAGVLELLPIIGPIIAAIPAVLLALTAGLDVAVAAVILYTGIQQLENYFLVPKIQGDAVELHPSAVMFALVIGGAIAGLLGAILALPISAAARDVFRYLFHRFDDPPATPDEAVARIRARPTIVQPVPEPAADAADAEDAELEA